MNKRGIALIVTFMVIVVLTILGLAIISRSVSERFIAQRYAESMQAFWLAEAGVNRALKELADYSVSSGNCKWETNLGAGRYCVDLSDEDDNGRRTLIAHGYIPSTTPSRAERTITVLVESTGGSNPSNPGLLTYAIEASGTLKIGKEALKNMTPPGSYNSNSALTFEQVFGMTEEQVRAIAVSAAANGTGYVYQDPGTDVPANGITWVDLSSGKEKYKISGTHWSGSGLLIVNGSGNSIDLDISGGQFTGVIWVTGRVSISGGAHIYGSIFARSSIDAQSDVTGDPTLSFNSTDVASAFSLLGAGGSGELTVLSWREI